jgi:hypothetical protein
MIELVIAVALIVSTVVYFKIKNKKSDTTPDNKSEKPTKQEIKPADKVVVSAESVTPPAPKVSEPVQVIEPVSHVEVTKPIVAQASHKLEKSPEQHKNLPQDSALRRHYLSHLRAMITSVNPAHPTDSTLSRHYDTQIAAQIEQCLSHEDAMQQLIVEYANYKKTLTAAVAEKPQTIVAQDIVEKAQTAPSPKLEINLETVSKIPQDSLLRRHYLTHLHAQVAANMPPRPTDSTLRRHHDTLLENEVKNRLATQA